MAYSSFLIKNSFSLNKNYYSEIYSLEQIGKLNIIKSSFIENINKIFFCYYGVYKYRNCYSFCKIGRYSICYNYDLNSTNIKLAFEYKFNDCTNFETYSFKENNDYILICNYNSGILLEKISDYNISNYNWEYVDIPDCKIIYYSSLVFNNFSKKYALISDCLTYNNTWSIIYIDSIFSSYDSSPILSSIPFSTQFNNFTTISSEIQNEYPFFINSTIPINIPISNIPFSTYSTYLISSIIISEINSSTIHSTIPETISNSIHSSIPFKSSKDLTFTNIINIQSSIINFNDIKNEAKINNEIITEKEIEKDFNGGKDELLENLDDLINNITIGQKYKITGDDFTLIIKPTNSTFLENTTHVNFTKCENILRKELNISPSRIITFLQLEIDNKNDKSLVNKVEYQAYDDNKNILNLSLCNDSSIEIFYAMKDNSLDMDYISSFKDLGFDIFNINDSFFNDICQPYSDSKNDLVLEDRIKEIYQNYSLCDEGCTYNGINTELKVISCDCKVKTNISTNESSINLEKFDKDKIESNFGLIKCYNLVFSLKEKLNNIGFWIFTILVIIHIPFLFNYFCKGIEPIKKYIINEMKKYGYIKDKKKKQI